MMLTDYFFCVAMCMGLTLVIPMPCATALCVGIKRLYCVMFVVYGHTVNVAISVTWNIQDIRSLIIFRVIVLPAQLRCT